MRLCWKTLSILLFWLGWYHSTTYRTTCIITYLLDTLPTVLAWHEEHSELAQIHCKFEPKFRNWNLPKGHSLCRCLEPHHKFRKIVRPLHSVQQFDCPSHQPQLCNLQLWMFRFVCPGKALGWLERKWFIWNEAMHTVLLKRVCVVIWRNPWARIISGTNAVVIISLSSMSVRTVSQSRIYGNIAGGVPVIPTNGKQLIQTQITSSINLNVDGPCWQCGKSNWPKGPTWNLKSRQKIKH